MNLFVQELNAYQIINQKIQMSTEMACFDIFFHLDGNALSEETLILDAQILEAFEAELRERIVRNDKLNIVFEDLTVSFLKDRHPNRLHLKFEYPYETQFVFKGLVTKRVNVELSYELPVNN
jgi:hypothetical protein